MTENENTREIESDRHEMTRREFGAMGMAAAMISWPDLGIFGPGNADWGVANEDDIDDYKPAKFDAFLAPESGKVFVPDDDSWKHIGTIGFGGGSGDGETVRTRQATVPLTEITNGNTAVGLRKHVPDGKTLVIFEAGVEDDSGSAPSGLTIEARDLTNDTNLVSLNTRHGEDSPIASVSGPVDVSFRIANATGDTINASGYVLYTME